MKFRFSRIDYYLASIFSILNSFEFINLDKIGIKNSSITLKLGNWRNLLIVKEVLLDREYEKHHKLVPRDKVIVDIGAGIGDFIIDAAVRFPKSKLYAFESDPKIFELLKRNIANNSLVNVFAYNIAVRSLKQVLNITKQEIDFLKIDCEGCEFSILNSDATPSLSKIQTIALEYHLQFGSYQILDSLLKKSGFEVDVESHSSVKTLGHLYATK